MSVDEVDVEGKRLPVRHTSRQRLKTVTFVMGTPKYPNFKIMCSPLATAE